MKQGDVQRMLVATNRWWRDPRGWSRDDPDLRDADDAPFRYSAGVLDDLAPGGLYVLRGPRRVGKSVEVKRAIETLIAGGAEPRRILHASVDGWRANDAPSGSSTRSPASRTAGRNGSSGCATTTRGSAPTPW